MAAMAGTSRGLNARNNAAASTRGASPPMRPSSRRQPFRAAAMARGNAKANAKVAEGRQRVRKGSERAEGSAVKVGSRNGGGGLSKWKKKASSSQGGVGNNNWQQRHIKHDGVGKLIAQGKLRECVRVITTLDEDTKLEILSDETFFRLFFKSAFRHKASKDAYALLLAVESVRDSVGLKRVDETLASSVSQLASSVIWVSSLAHDPGTAEKALDHVARGGVTPNVSMYTAAVSACTRKADVENAGHIFRRAVVEDGIVPDAFMYCALLKVYRNAITKAGKHARRSNGSSSSHASNSVSEGSRAVPDRLFGEVLDHVDAMKDGGVEGDVGLYNCLISTCAAAGALEEAETFFQEMQVREWEREKKSQPTLAWQPPPSRSRLPCRSLFPECLVSLFVSLFLL